MRWVSTSTRQSTVPIEQIGVANCNDQIAARAFGAETHIDPRDLYHGARGLTEAFQPSEYEAAFITMGKVWEGDASPWMDAARLLCDAGKKVVLFQEAETPWPLTRTWEEQKRFIQLLGKVDLFLTHNQRDVELWGRLMGEKGHCQRWVTCLDTDMASKYRIETNAGRPILVGSTYDARANGMTGLIACRGLLNPLWHQNRTIYSDARDRELPKLLDMEIAKEIPQSGWEEWLRNISGTYIAVHPMPAAAAGRDQIAFAALGIPCIGNRELDIQRELFPELAVDCFDVVAIRDRVNWLLSNPDVYEALRDYAILRVNAYSLTAAQGQASEIKGRMGWA